LHGTPVFLRVKRYGRLSAAELVGTVFGSPGLCYWVRMVFSFIRASAGLNRIQHVVPAFQQIGDLESGMLPENIQGVACRSHSARRRRCYGRRGASSRARLKAT
jgi:hypothetical protein